MQDVESKPFKMQRNQSPSCAKCNKGSQFAAHSASNVSKLSVKSMPMPRPSRNCKANKRSHRDVEAQQSSDQVAYWSYCHLLRFSSHWDPTHRYGLSCNDTGKLICGVRDAGGCHRKVYLRFSLPRAAQPMFFVSLACMILNSRALTLIGVDEHAYR